MIVFEKITCKNFLSTGNSPISVDLNKHKSTLIAGTNGNGKSLVANAISFALFGRSIKDINKANLVNSINGKGCLVTIEFSLNGKSYKINRGIKPNVFEVYENNVLLDQTGVRDYQDHLEKNILKTTYKSFIQTTIVSIENYTPFMVLRAHERRAFIEDLLDISVFSTMNTLLKNQISETKQDVDNITVAIKNAKDKCVLQKNSIDFLEQEKGKLIKSIEEKITEYQNSITVHMNNIEKHTAVATELGNKIAEATKVVDSMVELSLNRKKLVDGLTRFNEKFEFYHDIENCPTCKQGVEGDHKQSLINDVAYKKQVLEKNIKDLDSKLEKIKDARDIQSNLLLEQSSVNSEINKLHNAVSSLYNAIRQSQEQIEQLKADTGSVDVQKKLLKQMAQEVVDLNERKIQLSELRTYQEVMYNLLKDTGIKTQIIKQYIPIINQLVNKYMTMLDFFVSFELDENFNEVIKSRHRDQFSYHNFSAGEKARIDLSLIFAFRQIAKMKNSFNSNLLFMDEICDSALDFAGIDNLFNIFDSGDLKDTNIIVISHRNKDLFQDRFASMIEVKKVGGFTELTT